MSAVGLVLIVFLPWAGVVDDLCRSVGRIVVNDIVLIELNRYVNLLLRL